MTAQADEFPKKVLEKLSHETGRRFDAGSLHWIARPEGKSDVADATLALRAEGQGDEGDVVLLVSNEAFPLAVAEAVARLEEVSALLKPQTAARILQPVAATALDGRSFAAFPRMRPMADRGIGRHLDKRLAARHVVSWLTDVARETRQPCPGGDVDHLFRAPLAEIAGDPDMPAGPRQAAALYLARLDAVREDLFTIVEHSDFWTGNVLFGWSTPACLAPARGDFTVIDWRGAHLNGYPFIDLIRFCLSSRRPGAAGSRKDLETYAAALNLSPDMAGLYGLAAMGRVGMNRGEFPKKRYVALVDRIARFLSGHGYLAAEQT